MNSKYKRKEIQNLGRRLSALGIHPLDELCIYLVGSGIKPAAEIELIPQYDIYSKLDDMGFKVGIRMREWAPVVLDIALDEQRFNALFNARTGLECGLALGFPKIAVKRYVNLDSSYSYNDFTKDISIALLKQNKVPVSSAYVLNTPFEVVLYNGIAMPDKYSNELALRYMKYVRSKNRPLARKIETETALDLSSELTKRSLIRKGDRVVVNGEYFDLVLKGRKKKHN